MANSHPRAVPWDERWEGRKRCGEMVVGCRIGGQVSSYIVTLNKDSSDMNII